jgi:hypothetical protein
VTQPDERLQYPLGRYWLPMTGEEMEVLRPSGATFPVDVRVRWITPGAGRETLNEMLANVLLFEIGKLAEAVAAGEKYDLEPLSELAQREGWQIESRVDGNSYRLTKHGNDQSVLGPRRDLLRALELTIRCALKPFDSQANIPKWVSLARAAHPKLLVALDGQELFEGKSVANAV